MTLSGRIVGINSDGTVTILVDQTREQIVRNPYAVGNGIVGFQFGPSVGDLVHLDAISNIYLTTSKAVTPTNLLGRVLPDGSRIELKEGEALFYGKAGQQIFLDSEGNIELLPGPNGKVILNSDQKDLKAVARQGDTVTVPGIGTGTINTTQSTVEA